MTLPISLALYGLAFLCACSNETRNAVVDTAVVSLDSASVRDSSTERSVPETLSLGPTDSLSRERTALPRSTHNPGQNLTVDVRITSIQVRGDTIRVGYQVGNLATSAESLATFHVDAPSGATRLSRPGLRGQWAAMSAYRGRSIATWIAGSTVPPGQVSPELSFESVGLPDIVTYWVQGEFEPPEDESGPTESEDPMVSHMVNGKTVGIKRLPANNTPATLAARLHALTVTSCGPPLRWITNAEICSQLLADVQSAERYGNESQSAQAKQALRHYMTLLGSADAPSSGVTNPGFWLLRSNVEIALMLESHAPEPGR